MSARLNAPRERVYEALVTGEQVARWNDNEAGWQESLARLAELVESE